jgi:hypothetical protein
MLQFDFPSFPEMQSIFLLTMVSVVTSLSYGLMPVALSDGFPRPFAWQSLWAKVVEPLE